VYDRFLETVTRVLATVALALTALTVAGCAQGPSASSSSALARSAVTSDLYKANSAVLKFLAANSGDAAHPTTATLRKYGFAPSKYTKKFEYFSNSGGIRYCLQASTPTGTVYKLYLENDSKFSSPSVGACIAGTNY
jgi:hypothetical protein